MMFRSVFKSLPSHEAHWVTLWWSDPASYLTHEHTHEATLTDSDHWLRVIIFYLDWQQHSKGPCRRLSHQLLLESFNWRWHGLNLGSSACKAHVLPLSNSPVFQGSVNSFCVKRKWAKGDVHSGALSLLEEARDKGVRNLIFEPWKVTFSFSHMPKDQKCLKCHIWIWLYWKINYSSEQILKFQILNPSSLGVLINAVKLVAKLIKTNSACSEDVDACFPISQSNHT